MTFATLFFPSGHFGLLLGTRLEGGPFLLKYKVSHPSQHARCANEAEWLLWNYVHANAPGVFRQAREAGWVRPPIGLVRTSEQIGA
jgi:hypothetical protein